MAPKKPNWDLKRDIETNVEYLDRQTQVALVNMLSKFSCFFLLLFSLSSFFFSFFPFPFPLSFVLYSSFRRLLPQPCLTPIEAKVLADNNSGKSLQEI
jgi:hypothetical protein